MHKAAARLPKVIVRAGGSIAAVAAGIVGAPDLPSIPRTTARAINKAASLGGAVAVARPAPIPHAVKRAAAPSVFTATLMLAGAPAGAFTIPLNSISYAARIAAPPAARDVTQAPIAINYAPNVVIHSDNTADGATLKRRVMGILERHGRELHQVLVREVVRQQRRDFVNPTFDE